MQQVSALAEDLKKQASGVAQDVTRQVKEQASQLAESAKDAASGAGERLRDAAEDQKNAGADFVSGLAGAVRRAAGEFDDQIPQAGQYIRRAAQQIDGASEALRQRDLGELFEGVQDFARRQPTAFLGMTVLVGFAAVRFLKSSTASRQGGESRSRRNEGQDFSPRGPQSENARHLAGAGSGMSQNQGM
jgi:gas vesicle protein